MYGVGMCKTACNMTFLAMRVGHGMLLGHKQSLNAATHVEAPYALA